MRLNGRIGVAAAALLMTSSVSFASLLVHDDFNRADGNLVGTNPTPGPGGTWAAHSGANGPVQITSGTIQIIQNASGTAAQDVNVPTGETLAAGGRWYSAFDVTVNQPGASISNVVFAHFLQGTSNFTSRLWVTGPTTSGFRLALSNDGDLTDGGEAFSSDLTLGNSYRVVVSYDFTGQNGTLWIGQALESGASLPATDPGFSNAVSAFAFRQGSPSGSLTTTQTIDNVCVATSYNEAYNCVPEPGTLALFAIGALGLIRRSRQ